MKPFIALLFLGLQAGLLYGQTPAVPAKTGLAKSTQTDFLIVPGNHVGPIRANTSEAELVRLLGRSVVTAGDALYGAEGAEEVGTTLYKGTADEVQIYYKDAKRTRPETVVIRPNFYDEEGNPRKNMSQPRWVSADGLRIGTTLKELEQRNGKSFKIWGFGWDYSGQIASWQGGKMTAPTKKPFISLALGPPVIRTPAQEKAYNNLLGDGEFLSSGAAMQLLNPLIMTMTTSF